MPTRPQTITLPQEELSTMLSPNHNITKPVNPFTSLTDRLAYRLAYNAVMANQTITLQDKSAAFIQGALDAVEVLYAETT